MDNTRITTIEQLRQRYNFDKIGSNTKAIELQKNTLTKINAEQESILKSIILNMEGLESQSDISLWFFSAIPTLENEPYINWTNPELHIGDLYFNRETGYVYKFNGTWVQISDSNLIQAMALTNASIDTLDSERKVFFNQPIPPYNNGDWWVSDVLKICQISRLEGSFEANDFIIATKYVVGTQATDINNKITVLKGSVSTIEQGVDNITNAVTQTTTLLNGINNEIETINTQTSQLTQRANNLEISITSINEGSLSKLTNTTVVIDASGINVSKSGEQLKTLITNNSFEVKRDTTTVLKVDNTGVVAENIKANNYLTVGTKFRMEDYEDGIGFFYLG